MSFPNNNHGAPWDIKLKDPWLNTIGTEFPGENTVVLYSSHYVTPEGLGNYTYGVLGNAYGIPLELLLLGSYHAAGYPSLGTKAYDNEMQDWLYIANGYYGWP